MEHSKEKIGNHFTVLKLRKGCSAKRNVIRKKIEDGFYDTVSVLNFEVDTSEVERWQQQGFPWLTFLWPIEIRKRKQHGIPLHKQEDLSDNFLLKIE